MSPIERLIVAQRLKSLPCCVRLEFGPVVLVGDLEHFEETREHICVSRKQEERTSLIQF